MNRYLFPIYIRPPYVELPRYRPGVKLRSKQTDEIITLTEYTEDTGSNTPNWGWKNQSTDDREYNPYRWTSLEYLDGFYEPI